MLFLRVNLKTLNINIFANDCIQALFSKIMLDTMLGLLWFPFLNTC